MGYINRIHLDHKEEIQTYCNENGLSAKKLFSSPISCNKVSTYFLYIDPNPTTEAVMGGPPAPITLAIHLEENGHLRFEQTEHTYRLREHRTAAEPAVA